MSRFNLSIIVYSFVLFILFFSSSFFSHESFWGINHLKYISGYISYVFLVIFLLGTILSIWIRESHFVKINEFIDNKIVFSLFLIVMAFCFYIFRVPTHFLGDGYTWISNFSFDDSFVKKPTEFLSTYFIRFVQTITGSISKESSLLAFQLTSYFSGIVFLVLVKNITDILFKDTVYRILCFFTFLFSGSLLLFFGYVEFYPLYWMTATLFIFFSLKAFDSTVYLYLSIPAYLLMILTHAQGIYLTLGFIYLFLHKKIDSPKINRLLKKNVVFISSGLVFIGVLILYVAYTNRVISQILLPLFSSRADFPGYFVFSVSHIIDIINQIFLVSPLFLILFLLVLLNFRNIKFDKISNFLLLSSIGSLAFLLLVNPYIGFARDWDLLSFTLFCPTLTVIYLLSKSEFRLKAGTVAITLFLMVSLGLSYVIVNNDVNTSVKRYRDILESQNGMQFRPGWTILNNYYAETNQIEKSNEVKNIIREKFKEYSRLETGLNFLAQGNYQQANIISSELINRYPNNIDFVQFRAKLFVETQMFDSAKYYIDHGFTIQSKYPALLKVYGEYLIRRNDFPGALKALENAYTLTRKNTEIAEPLALCYIRTNEIQKAIGIAKDVYDEDKNSPSYHIISLMIYMQRNDKSKAAEHYKKFLEVGQNRSDYLLIKESYKNLLTG